MARGLRLRAPHWSPSGPIDSPCPQTCDQQTQSLDQQLLPPERLYVALPGHPLYGRSVPIIRRRITDTATHCLIEDPEHPSFCYQILARWLSAEPPPPAVPLPSTPGAIAVSLVALDRFVQLVWGKYPPRASEGNDSEQAHPSGADLAAHPPGATSATQRAPVLPSLPSCRRSSS